MGNSISTNRIPLKRLEVHQPFMRYQTHEQPAQNDERCADACEHQNAKSNANYYNVAPLGGTTWGNSLKKDDPRCPNYADYYRIDALQSPENDDVVFQVLVNGEEKEKEQGTG